MRRAENPTRAAVVLLQPDDLRPREVLREVEDVVHLRAAPAVDGLVIVADHAEVSVDGGELAEQLVLGRIGVLELVHQDVAKASGVSLQDVVPLLEQLADPDDQVAEIDGVRRLQRRLVAPVHFEPGLPGYVVLRYAHLGG